MEGKKSLLEHESKTECCMCGDYGLFSELVQCQTCHFRSQHSYCSNLYPKAESFSYRVCNWCLVQEFDDKAKHKTQKSQDLGRKNRREDLMIEIKKTKNKNKNNGFDEQSILNDVGREISALDQPIQRSRSSAGSERVAVGCAGGAQGRVSRKAQVNVSSNKRGVRKMVRRYKFLDEVLASELQI